MLSPLKILQTNTFTNGQNSDIAPDLMPNDTYRYMLNCNVLSTAEGNVGVVTNLKGNTMIHVDLPEGDNRTIGVALDEESNFLYYAVWNSEGYHTWYRYSSVNNMVDRVLQSKTDTNNIDIFNWPPRTLILHANVIQNELLYWTMEGQPARKFNIRKAMDKSDMGYGASIAEEFTRAYKKTSVASPLAEYFTDTSKKFNRLYGYQFQFAQRYWYDDGEKSEVSDWSVVPNPDEEYFTGTLGVPERNNGIRVTVETGTDIVKSIEILMRKTNPEGGTMPWVSVVILDKGFHNITSGSTYAYSFYNDGAYIPVDPKYPIRNNSSLPRAPKCQDFTKNSLMYANSVEGRDPVDIDVEWTVDYQEIFVDDGQQSELNNPFFGYVQTNQGAIQSGGFFGGSAWRYIEGTFTIGSDVKAGNRFHVYFTSAKDGSVKRMEFSVTAGLTDRAETIANKLVSQMLASEHFGPALRPGGFAGPVTLDGAGNANFNVRVTNNAGWGYWAVTTPPVNRVNVISLQDTGQSVRNIKNGSSTKYGIVYRDEDGRKELVQTNDGMIVPIMTMNELGGLKKPTITFQIKHRPPVWAKEYSIVRTKDLVYSSYIQILIQEVVSIETGSGDKYYDLVVGSLFTYQQLHPNSILRYEFKKGDRVRSMYAWNETELEFDVISEAKDFEVIAYNPVTDEVVNSDITVDNSATASTTSASSDNIGNYILIGDHERLITGAEDGVSYSLNAPYPSGDNPFTFPSYRIINRRGTIRIKADPDFPMEDLTIVEVYSPSSGDLSVSEDQFYEFSQRYDIINWGTENAYHAGNVQDQTSVDNAVIEISQGSSYVRNRELPTNNTIHNPQVLVGLIEDPNYSDFYVSDMTDDGKVNVVDQGFGEVLLNESVWWSNNYIEGTRINGLNDFDASNRRDYNDKYGSIQRILFSEDRLYIFKHLKTAWATVYARRITETTDTGIIAASPDILPEMLTYFLWEGGVGNNPESVNRNGNHIYMVSADSGIMARIGGAGVEPISKTFALDRETRDLISSAKRAGAFIISWFDRKNDNAEFSFESHDNVVYDLPFTYSSWSTQEGEAPQTMNRAYYGLSQSGQTPDLATIEASSSVPIAGNSFTIPFTDLGVPRYYWVAYPLSFAIMNAWRDPDNPLNAGQIGSPGSVFGPYSTVGQYRVTITIYPTQFGDINFTES